MDRHQVGGRRVGSVATARRPARVQLITANQAEWTDSEFTNLGSTWTYLGRGVWEITVPAGAAAADPNLGDYIIIPARDVFGRLVTDVHSGGLECGVNHHYGVLLDAHIGNTAPGITVATGLINQATMPGAGAGLSYWTGLDGVGVNLINVVKSSSSGGVFSTVRNGFDWDQAVATDVNGETGPPGVIAAIIPNTQTTKRGKSDFLVNSRTGLIDQVAGGGRTINVDIGAVNYFDMTHIGVAVMRSVITGAAYTIRVKPFLDFQLPSARGISMAGA